MKTAKGTTPESSSNFSQKTYRFFKELEQNNNRQWFTDHRPDYDAFVAGPLRSLASGLATTMQRIDGLFDLLERRVVSRPHRDVRFSKDKAPYHTAAWLLYRRPGTEWTAAPAYYLEVSSKGIRYGMGFYQAPPRAMQRLRKMIDEDPKRFRSILTKIEKQPHIKIEGDAYARPIANAHGEWFQTYYQKRNLYVMCSIGKSTDPEGTLRQLKKDFAFLAPFYRLLLECVTE